MGGTAIAFAWALSLAFVALDGGLALAGKPPAFDGASRAGLALLPWLVVAGMPRRGREQPRFAGLVPLAFALPTVGLGLGLDVASGASVTGAPPVLWFTLGGLATLLAWSLAAERARQAPRAALVHAVTWLAVVPGFAALWCALAWAPRGGGGELDGGAQWIETLAPLASPCAWSFHWTRAEQFAELTSADASRSFVVLGVGVLAWAQASWLAARERGARP